MEKEKLDSYRSLLEKRRVELEQEVAEALRDRDRLAAVKAPDELEAAALTAEREFAISNLDRVSKLLRQVKVALEHTRDGSYGICQRCEEPISPARLKAVPWAEYCVPCQEIVDEENRQGWLVAA